MSENQENNNLPSLTLSSKDVEDPDSSNFSARVKHMRSMRGLTLKALSIATKVVDPSGQGISTVSISRYESGADPGLRELRLLSLALHRPLSYFVYGESIDPFQSPHVSLDLLLEDMMCDVVDSVLKKKGLIEPESNVVSDVRDREQYDAMIELVKKLAK